jgi:TPP-dependent pyruvate/acetoin dehydrogenase alpha subunit
VAEQLPYAIGAARSIILDKHLGTGEEEDRITIVFVGDGGAQNGGAPGPSWRFHWL